MALVTLQEVKRHLSIPESETTYDTELDVFILAATPIVEHIVGPIEARAVTETHNPRGRSRIMLRTVPVLTVTTVTEYIGTQSHVLANEPLGNPTSTQYAYSLDNADAGLVVRRTNGIESCFLGAEVVVVYQAGRSTTPANVKLAALEDIRALWSQTQVAARPEFGGGGVVMGPDSWNQDLHLFPRLAYLVEGERFIEGIA